MKKIKYVRTASGGVMPIPHVSINSKKPTNPNLPSLGKGKRRLTGSSRNSNS